MLPFLAVPWQKPLFSDVVETSKGLYSIHWKGTLFCDRRGKIPLLILFYVVLNIPAGSDFIYTSFFSHSMVKLAQTNVSTGYVTYLWYFGTFVNRRCNIVIILHKTVSHIYGCRVILGDWTGNLYFASRVLYLIALLSVYSYFFYTDERWTVLFWLAVV